VVIRSRIPDNFSTSFTIAEDGILGDLLAFLIQYRMIFTILGKMTDADRRMNPLHFGSNLTVIQIRVNPDLNPGSLLLAILAKAEVCTLSLSSRFRCVVMQVRPQLQASSGSSPMAQMRTVTGGMAAGMSANAAAASQLLIAAAAGGQSYQYAALGTSQLLTQDSAGLGFPVSCALTLLVEYREGDPTCKQTHRSDRPSGIRP